MRKPTRVSVQHLESQKTKRKTLVDEGPSYGNSVPELRARVTMLETIVGIRPDS